HRERQRLEISDGVPQCRGERQLRVLDTERDARCHPEVASPDGRTTKRVRIVHYVVKSPRETRASFETRSQISHTRSTLRVRGAHRFEDRDERFHPGSILYERPHAVIDG